VLFEQKVIEMAQGNKKSRLIGLEPFSPKIQQEAGAKTMGNKKAGPLNLPFLINSFVFLKALSVYSTPNFHFKSLGN